MNTHCLRHIFKDFLFVQFQILFCMKTVLIKSSSRDDDMDVRIILRWIS